MTIRLNRSVAWLALWTCSFQCIAQEPQASALTITVLEGQGAINNVKQRSTRDAAVVRVDDAAKQPVSGASVVFTLPSQGAGGAFSNGEQTLIVTTDAQGKAVARGLKPNNIAGKFDI